jgi:hypothetical protein
MSYRQAIPACASLGAGSVNLQRRGRQPACALSANKRAVAASCARAAGTRPPANVRWLRPPRVSSTLTRARWRGGEGRGGLVDHEGVEHFSCPSRLWRLY